MAAGPVQALLEGQPDTVRSEVESAFGARLRTPTHRIRESDSRQVPSWSQPEIGSTKPQADPFVSVPLAEACPEADPLAGRKP